VQYPEDRAHRAGMTGHRRDLPVGRDFSPGYAPDNALDAPRQFRARFIGLHGTILKLFVALAVIFDYN
jgi:hypothetical protein